MPDPVWRNFDHPFHGGYRLEQAAADGQIVEQRCGLCRRLVRYLAADLVRFHDPRRHAMLPFGSCPKCGSDNYLGVTLRMPVAGDYGSLEVLRPGPVITRQPWYLVKLGDDPSPPAEVRRRRL